MKRFSTLIDKTWPGRGGVFMAPSHHPNSCLFDEDPGIMSEADTSSTRWAKNGHFPDEKVRWIEEYHVGNTVCNGLGSFLATHTGYQSVHHIYVFHR